MMVVGSQSLLGDVVSRNRPQGATRRRRWLRPRWVEFGLLMLGFAPGLVGVAVLSSVWERSLLDQRFWPAYGFVIAFVACHLVLVVAGTRSSQLLLPLVACLAGIGMVLVTRLVPALAPRQLLWIVLGLSVAMTVTVGPWETYLLARFKYSIAAGGIVLVALTLVAGTDPNGSGDRLWLGFGAYVFQPSELLKVLLVVFLAGYLVDKRNELTQSRVRLWVLPLPPLAHLLPVAAMWGFCLLLLIVQRDLGSALLFYGVFLTLLYVALGGVWYVIVSMGLFLGGATLCYFVFAHVRVRVEIWLDPWIDPLGRSFQIIQAMYSLGSGGLFGRGFGNGYPLYVPATHTDYPFVALAEEAGLLAAVGLLLIYAVLATHGLSMAIAARQPYRQLLTTGLVAIIVLQVIVIVGGNLRLIPLTGVTLPFVSYGGSSLLGSFLLVGLLLRLSHEEQMDQSRRDIRRLLPEPVVSLQPSNLLQGREGPGRTSGQ